MVAATHIGTVREINEDSLRIIPSLNLAVIADGMSGHKAGDIASRMAVNALCAYFEEQTMLHDQIDGRIYTEILVDGFSLANSTVYANSHQLLDCEGMGTTMIAATFQENVVHIGHIGDSRIYNFSYGKLKQLSTDHTVASELSIDTLSWQLPAYNYHILSKVLGIESTCKPDFFTIETGENQIYLMCSDGLTSVVSDHDISTILSLRSHQPEQCLDTMIDACLDNGAPDNISIILIFSKKH